MFDKISYAKMSVDEQTAYVTRLTNGVTKSAVIRYLDSTGCTRSEIAKILNIRYQHVRNVLTSELKRHDVESEISGVEAKIADTDQLSLEL